MRQSLRPDEGARGPTDPFDGRTGYRDDYIKHPMEKPMQREKECYKGPGAPLDGKVNFATSVYVSKCSNLPKKF